MNEEWPEAPVAVSHELTSERREYDRTSTVVLDAYVKPIAAGYLAALESGWRRPASAGGHRHAVERRHLAVRRRCEVADPARRVGTGRRRDRGGGDQELIGERNLITLDIGGTTAKASLVEGDSVQAGGRLRDRAHARVRRLPDQGARGRHRRDRRRRRLDRWIDPVGAQGWPAQRGRRAGPACYGRGGTEPTLTDANVIAGRINPDYFLGGRISLDLDRARDAFAPIAGALDVSVDDAALGVIRIANANMIHLLKLVSVRRGRDPRLRSQPSAAAARCTRARSPASCRCRA